jgi:hypothetical protein
MGYFIITSKHHDGFAMWPTKVNDYNVMDATPWHHDPMADLRAACKKYGLKFGFYYSHAFDWGNSNAPGNDWDYHNPGGDKLIGGRDWWETKPEFMTQARKYVDEKAIPQLRELIKLYDPDILWFDTPSKLPPSENFRIMKAVREASPRVVINGRLVHGWGDYDSTADRPAEFSPHEGDWEGIPTTNESYGWNKFDRSHKPPSHFIQLLAKAAARGGNVLMNVGPMGTGEMDPNDVAILRGIGDWWQVNGEAIRGTTRTPLPAQSWGESTRKGNRLYLHVFNWPANGQLVVGGLKSEVTNAWLLASKGDGVALDSGGMRADEKRQGTAAVHDASRGSGALESASAFGLRQSSGPFPSGTNLILPAQSGNGGMKAVQVEITRLNLLDVSLIVPPNAPDKADSVIVLECSGEISADATRLLQPSFGSETLRVFDAKLHGKELKFGPGKTRDAHVTGWTRTGDFIGWPVRLNAPATYDVSATYDAEPNSVGNTFALTVGDQQVKGTVEPGVIRTAALGRISLKPGSSEMKIVPVELKGGELMQLRTLELRAVAE